MNRTSIDGSTLHHQFHQHHIGGRRGQAQVQVELPDHRFVAFSGVGHLRAGVELVKPTSARRNLDAAAVNDVHLKRLITHVISSYLYRSAAAFSSDSKYSGNLDRLRVVKWLKLKNLDANVPTVRPLRSYSQSFSPSRNSSVKFPTIRVNKAPLRMTTDRGVPLASRALTEPALSKPHREFLLTLSVEYTHGAQEAKTSLLPMK